MEHTNEVTTNDNQGSQDSAISPSMAPANNVSNGGTKAQYNWVDITKEFQTSVQGLLGKSDYFIYYIVKT